MRRVLYFVIASWPLSMPTLYGQGEKKCDISIIASTQDKAGKLSKEEVKDFLLTFGKDCQNNVEFSEFSNEVLFLVLDKQTELTLKTIEEAEKQIELDEILDELSSPITDAIAVKTLIPRVEKAKINERLKKLILDRLKTAESSMH